MFPALNLVLKCLSDYNFTKEHRDRFYIYIHVYNFSWIFFLSVLSGGFLWGLFDNKSGHQDSSKYFSRGVVWMVLILSLVFKSTSSLSKTMVTVPEIGITVTNQFFFQLAVKIQEIIYIFLFFHFHWYSKIPLMKSYCAVFWSKVDYPFVSQNSKKLYVTHFLGEVLVCAYTIIIIIIIICIIISSSCCCCCKIPIILVYLRNTNLTITLMKD